MADIDDLLAAVAAGPRGPEIGAFFDFDGTLIHGYSAALYFRQRLASRAMSPQELLGTIVEVFNMQQRGHDVTRLVGVGLGALRGTAQTDMEEMGQQLFRSRISGQLYPDARRLVLAHLRAGHTVASSATRFQAQAAAEDLGIEHLLVTEIEVLDGIVTGRVDGPILCGPGRAAAVVAFADEQGLDLGESYAYGNGGEDFLDLETVGGPRPLNADSTLTQSAGERGWSVHRLHRQRRLTAANVVRSAASYAGLATGVVAGLGMGLVNRDRRTALTLAPQSAPSSHSAAPVPRWRSRARRTSGSRVRRCSSSTIRASSTSSSWPRSCAATSPVSPRRSSPRTPPSQRWAGLRTSPTSTAPPW